MKWKLKIFGFWSGEIIDFFVNECELPKISFGEDFMGRRVHP